MGCLQASLCWSSANGNRISLPQSCNLRAAPLQRAVQVLPSRSKWLRPDRGGSRRRHRGPPVCLFGGKGDAKDDRDASPWKSLEKAMGNFGKERSIQDLLREQMKQQELGGDGGSGKPPDGGDEGDDYDDSEEYPEESPFREFIHEFLACIGIITLYIYLLGGDDLNKLTRDFILYKLGLLIVTVRLKRALRKWAWFQEKMRNHSKWKAARKRWLNGKKGCYIKKALLHTPTCWDRMYFQATKV